MSDETPATDRIKDALDKLQADIQKRGIKPPDPINFDFYIQAEKYLSLPSDKMYFAILLSVGINDPEEKAKSLKWAKSIYNQYKSSPDKIDLFQDIKENPIMFSQSLKFVSAISAEAAQELIDTNPILYLESRIFMKPEDYESFRNPTRENLEVAIGKLQKKDWRPEHLEIVQDPKLEKDILRALASDSSYAASVIRRELELRKSGKSSDNDTIQLAFRNMPEAYLRPTMLELLADDDLKKSSLLKLARNRIYSTDILDLELEKKKKGWAHDENLAEIAFSTRTGYKKDFPSPAEAGSIYIDFKAFETYGAKLKSPEEIKKILINLAKADPLIGMEYAAAEYPENKFAVDMYLAALPRVKELLTDPKASAVLIDLLNKLEPSQYAGRNHLLIHEKDVFKALDGASATQLYDLITQQQSSTGYGYSQGTYNEISKRFYEQLSKEKKTLSDLIRESPDREKNLKTFVQTAEAFRRMDDLVLHLNRDDHQRIAEILFKKEEGYNYDISTISSYIKHLPKGSPALSFIEVSIIEAALKGDDYSKADMGLLGRWYANQTIHAISPENKEFFNRVKTDPSFEVKDIGSIKSNKLLDAGGRNFQLHAFYNDKDGIDTFKSFSSSLKADGFQVKKQDDFLIFSKEINGKKIEILVSPPEKDGAPIPQIVDYIKSKNGVMSVLSGRGHAHHMEKAVELISPDTKVVALGGCWGHNYATSVLEKAPDAHILATTGVGRMAINNFNTKWINDQILSGRDINWTLLEKEWERLKKDKTLAKDIEQYVSPNQNILLLYERKRTELYQEIEKRSKGEEPRQTSQLNDTFMQSVRGTPPPSTPQRVSEAKPDLTPAYTA